MFKPHLIFGLLLLLGVSSQKDEDEGGPYEFSFTIDGEQHRYEKKDINGIVQGEFGFITGDGVYHVTVYATDESGSFKILSMKNTKLSEPLDRGGKPSTVGLVRQQTSVQQPTAVVQPKPAPPVAQPSSPVAQTSPPIARPSLPAAQPSPAAAIPTPPVARPAQPAVTTSRTPYDFTTASTVRNGCSGCGIVTKAPPGPLKFQNPAFKESSKEENKPIAPPVRPPSYPNKPVLPPGPSDNGIPSGLVSKPFLPAGQPSTYPDTPSGPSISLPDAPINIKPINSQPTQPPSYSNQPPLPPKPSGNGIPSGLISKTFSPTGQPSTYPNPPSDQNSPVNIGTDIGHQAPPSSSSNKPVTPPPQVSGNGIPTGLVSKSFSPAGEPSNYPNTPSSLNGLINTDSRNVQPAPPQTLLLAPGTKPVPTGSETPTEQNPFGPQPISINSPSDSKPLSSSIPVVSAPISQPLPGPTQNEIPGKPPSSLSQVKVTDGVINIPGSDPIPIKDKYPNMVDGLPEGITEHDITDLLYKFNYTVGFHGHYEKGLKDGSKIGGYFVNDRDGFSRVVTYVADENGYRPKFTLINLGLESEDTPKPDSEKKFGLKNFEFVWYPVKQ